MAKKVSLTFAATGGKGMDPGVIGGAVEREA